MDQVLKGWAHAYFHNLSEDGFTEYVKNFRNHKDKVGKPNKLKTKI